MASDHKKIFCPLAEHGIVTKTDGRYRMCCCSSKDAVDENGNQIRTSTHTVSQAFNSDFFKQIRNNLKNGVWDQNCQRCEYEESIRVESYRQSEIKRLNWAIDEKSTGNPKYIDMALGNTCNLKCRICNPSDSSAWIKEYFSLDYTGELDLKNFIKIKTHREKDLASNFFVDLKKICKQQETWLSFFGGEPFLIKNIWHFLKDLIDSDVSKYTNLVFNTNATVWDQDKKNILDQFKTVKLRLSIDGIGSKFEYLRYPAKWNKVVSNIEKIKEWQLDNHNRIDFGVDCSVSAYNVWNVDEVFCFFEELSVPVYINLVIEPTSISLSAISTNLAEKIIKRLISIRDTLTKENQLQISKIINLLKKNKNNPDFYRTFISHVDRHDKYRKEKFDKIFTDYSFLIRKNEVRS